MVSKVAIVGAGAIGGLIGFRCAQAGARVSVLARGATLANLQKYDLRMREPNGIVGTQPVQASNIAAELGEQELVVIALKAPNLPELAPRIAPLVGRKTQIMTAMNGIPWWFFTGLRDRMRAERLPEGNPEARIQLTSVDPDGTLTKRFPSAQVIGCVVHLAAFAPEPGMVQVRNGDQLILGAPDPGGRTTVPSVAAMLRKGGFQVEESPFIQRDIWYKLWGNMTINPISALCNATADRILDDDLVRDFASRCMREAADIGRQIGIPIDADPDERHAVTRKLGAFRTSMLQDVDARRPVELDALVGAVREIARQVGVPTPFIDALLGLSRLHARGLSLYPQASLVGGHD